MALVRRITIETDMKEDGTIAGYIIDARVEVAGEEKAYEFTTENPSFKAAVDQLLHEVQKEALEEARPEMQAVLDAESAFER